MKILFTGGVTGGHFYPIIAIAKKVRAIAKEEHMLDPDLYFMSPTPYDERSLFENDIKYIYAPSGKIRRYFSIKNFFDIFKTLAGVIKAVFEVFSIYPDVVFGKGGYGSFPALLAAKLWRIPVVIHESDTTPGKVNSWAGNFAAKVAVSYPDAVSYFGEEKAVWTGQPIRETILHPVSEGAAEYLKLESNVPVILVMGGSQGAERINDAILDALPDLLQKYQIIHQTGEEKFKEVVNTASIVLENNDKADRYKPFPYLNDLALRMAAGIASLIITRAGSTLFEVAAWGVPSIVVPIPEEVSQDQLKNAFSYARSGSAIVIEEKNLTPKLLAFEVTKLMDDEAKRKSMSEAAKNFTRLDAADKIARAIFTIASSHEQ